VFTSGFTNPAPEAACRDWDAITNLQFRGLSIHSAQFRVLKNLRGRVRQQEIRGCARQCENHVILIQVRELLQREAIVCVV
jgi:hypothetical protein